MIYAYNFFEQLNFFILQYSTVVLTLL